MLRRIQQHVDFCMVSVIGPSSIDTFVTWMGLKISKIFAMAYIRQIIIAVDSDILATFLLFCGLCN
jgi:hypothetical protein